MKAGVSKTFVLQAATSLSNNKYPVCSYFTVAPSSIKKTSLPAKLAQKLPHYPVPVFLLAQLAVHKDCQGQNLGKITLIKALEFLWEINSKMCAYAVVVDCLNETVEKFYAKYGVQILSSKNGKNQNVYTNENCSRIIQVTSRNYRIKSPNKRIQLKYHHYPHGNNQKKNISFNTRQVFNIQLPLTTYVKRTIIKPLWN